MCHTRVFLLKYVSHAPENNKQKYNSSSYASSHNKNDKWRLESVKVHRLSITYEGPSVVVNGSNITQQYSQKSKNPWSPPQCLHMQSATIFFPIFFDSTQELVSKLTPKMASINTNTAPTMLKPCLTRYKVDVKLLEEISDFKGTTLVPGFHFSNAYAYWPVYLNCSAWFSCTIIHANLLAL